MDETRNKVRQILMNELGLTRKEIREEMEDIIETTVAKHMNDLIMQKKIDEIVKEEIKRLAQVSAGWSSESIRSIVIKAAQNQVAAYLKDDLCIGTTLKIEVDKGDANSVLQECRRIIKCPEGASIIGHLTKLVGGENV